MEEGWGSSASHVIIPLGIVENPGCVHGSEEAQEGQPKHMSILEASAIVISANTPLTKTNHMAHPNSSGNEKYTPYLVRGTAKSYGKGQGHGGGNNKAIFQK